MIWGAAITPEPYNVDLFSRIPTLESRGCKSLTTIDLQKSSEYLSREKPSHRQRYHSEDQLFE